MSAPFRIEAYAIISYDGMIADENCWMPDTLKFDADQAFFESALDGVDLIIHGRKSHEGQANSPARRRLLMTRAVASFEADPNTRNLWLWNPAGASLERVCAALGLPRAIIAITGGTAAYDLFLDQYSVFHLCRAGKVQLPGGTPVFSQVGLGLSPEEVLRSNGLEPELERTLDPDHDLSHVCWRRKAGREVRSALSASGAVVPAMKQQI